MQSVPDLSPLFLKLFGQCSAEQLEIAKAYLTNHPGTISTELIRIATEKRPQ